MRPTGRLHLGHFFGALSNWLKLQNAVCPTGKKYECFFFVADWHALTTHYEDTSSIAENTLQVATDWLAVGLDPAKSTLFVQSSILEHAELHVLLSMITPLSWLERVPTYKEQIENLKDRDLGTYGFLGYPLLQSADIVIYDADFVPVGEDQVPHVEITREVVRRFNVARSACQLVGADCRTTQNSQVATQRSTNSMSHTSTFQAARLFRRSYRQVASNWICAISDKRCRRSALRISSKSSESDSEVLQASSPCYIEPGHLLTETPRLPGTDGRRMAKSYGNAIWLSDTPDEIRDEGPQHDDGPAAAAADRSRAAGDLPGVRVSQAVFAAGYNRAGRS